ncbi:MAG: hypothetical protein LBQ40_00130 [Clostridiales bacterium]|jgi:hypothetical protein|nr:hypothetical protein [Clostridiales bacterium]
MRNRIKIAVCAACLAVFLVVLSGCAVSEAKHYERLQADAEKFSENYKVLWDALNQTESYSYVLTMTGEYLVNYDSAERVMPEKKMRDRKTFVYSFQKNGNDFTAQAELTETEKLENGLPKFKDDDYKNPVYKPAEAAGYSYSGGRLTVKLGGETVYDGDIGGYDAFLSGRNSAVLNMGYGNILFRYFADADIDAVFATKTKKWFSSVVSSLTSYYVSDGIETPLLPSVAYQKSSVDYVKGFGEDLRFEWEKISGVSSYTYCYTSKKSKPTKLELYGEVFASNYKKSVQAWNGDETVTWYGDKIIGESLVFDISY